MTTGRHIVVIGGGIIGCLTAWFLRALGHAGAITVLEPDPTYQFSSTALSAASIRTQFACSVNVDLSLFGAAFLKSIGSHIGSQVDIGFCEQGYLILGDADSALERRVALAMQRAKGADVLDLNPAALARRFPWLDQRGVAIATFGARDEGWFDAWSLLQAVRIAALHRGVIFRQAAVTDFFASSSAVTSVQTSDGQVEGDMFVLAAGAASGRLASRLGIHLPIEPRKRTVFNFKGPLDPAGLPMLFDSTGLWMRPEGDGFIGGIAPDENHDPDADGDFEPDHSLFEDRFWPLLAARVPALEELRLQRSWAGHYEMNLFDHNGIVGAHSDLRNLVFATGFSGHGVMHAPGAARGAAEQLLFGEYRSIDLGPLGYDRIARGERMPESTIY